MTGTITTRADADRVAERVTAGLTELLEAEFWKFPGDDLLATARTVEQLARRVYAVQVAVAGEIDLARLAQTHGQASTAALLRHALAIGPGDAMGRVRAARQVLPQDAISGGEIPPRLPELGAALAAGDLGAEQTAIVVKTMARIPTDHPAGIRDQAEHTLVGHVATMDPIHLGRVADKLLHQPVRIVSTTLVGMARTRPTLAQVAARAGVSVSTASLAFSGSGPVSARTRERVLAAAEDLNYAGPDPRGRSLRQGRSGIIGVIMEDRVLAAFRDPVRIAVLDGIAQETSAQGLGLLLLSDVGASADAIGSATMDAAILFAFSSRSDRTVELLRRRALAVVAVGGPDHGLLTISIDDVAASASAAQHLAGLGHQEVAVIALPLVNVDMAEPDTYRGVRGPLTAEAEGDGTVTVTLNRLRGIRSVYPTATGWVAAGSSVEEGMVAGRALLTDPTTRPTAVIAQSDLLAAGVIKTAQELGLSVPGDLSVIGFDGIPLDRIIPQDLTTMVQPASDEGRAAGRAIMDLLDGGHPAPTRFACRFHRGATTAAPH